MLWGQGKYTILQALFIFFINHTFGLLATRCAGVKGGTMLQEVHREVEEVYAEWEEEKEQYMQQMRILHQQMRLKELVIDLFVPMEEVHKVTNYAKWNDEREQWILHRDTETKRKSVQVAKRPVSASGLRRPTSDFSKTANAVGDLNPRFRSENILCLDLDLPERTTFDYDPHGGPANVQQALNFAFAEGTMVLVPENSTSSSNLALVSSNGDSTGKQSKRTPSGRQRPSSARKGVRH